MIEGAEFGELFARFTDSAFRLETLENYREPHERDAIRRFVTGRPPDDSWAGDYVRLLRRLQAGGRRIERVRVLSRPLTTYQRFVMDLAARCTVPAGEDLRVLDQSHAETIGLSLGTDFWLFDDRLAALMHFEGGAFTGAELIDDSAEIGRLRALRQIAWKAARLDRLEDFAVYR
ncbi:MAG: DUF6879 family protein [Bryobacteraceae bacterium]